MGLALTIALFAFAAVVLSNPPSRANADSAHIVSIYFDGQKKVITTGASSVEGALKDANVSTSPEDLVEPARGTAMSAGFFNINIYRARPVEVVDGKKTVVIRTAYQSPKLIADAAGISTYPEDAFSTEVIQDLADAPTIGQRVTIHRAVQVIIQADGKQTPARTQQKTVGAFLNERDVALGAQDKVVPPLSTPITPNMVIEIIRVKVVQIKETKTVPRDVKTIKDGTLDAGITRVQTEGQDGTINVTYLVHYNNGIEKSREKLSEVVVQGAITKVVVVGTRINYSADPVSLGKQMAAARGWVGDDWTSLYNLWERESGWNPSSYNFFSGACGIPQALPCSKIQDHSAAGQISWGLDYIASKYGSPSNAWAFWQRNHYY